MVGIEHKAMQEQLRTSGLTRRGLVVGAVAAGAALPAIGSPHVALGAQSTPVAGNDVDKVTVLTGAEVRYFDPTRRFSSTDANPSVNIYEPLIRMTTSFELQPALATSWESVDETTWQFTLREGVTFHNGEPFNADTLVAWFVRLQNLTDLVPEAQSSIDQLPLVESVEKVGDLTVNFITSGPDPTLLRRLTTYYALIPPVQVFEDEGPDALANTGIGTGPYKFVEWIKDDHVLLEANPDYWGGEPKVKQLEFRPVPEPSARVSGLLAGEAQIADALPLAGVEQLDGADDYEVRSTREATRIYWCQWNGVENEYLQKLEVRQALNHAVDKQGIIDAILGGYAEQNASPVTFESFGYADVPEYEYDPDKARELLAQAGYPDGFTLSLVAALGRTTGDSEIIQAIIDFLADVGVTVEFEQEEFANYLSRLADHSIDGMTFGGKTIPALDADYMFTELQPEKQFGWMFPLTGEAAELFEQERNELDEDTRAELAAQIQQWYRDQAGALFLWQVNLLYGVSTTLKWQPRGDGLVLGMEMAGA